MTVRVEGEFYGKGCQCRHPISQLSESVFADCLPGARSEAPLTPSYRLCLPHGGSLVKASGFLLLAGKEFSGFFLLACNPEDQTHPGGQTQVSLETEPRRLTGCGWNQGRAPPGALEPGTEIHPLPLSWGRGHLCSPALLALGAQFGSQPGWAVLSASDSLYLHEGGRVT